MDFLKDTFDAIAERIRSPIIGSIIISFLLINWKPIWVLLFSDQNVAEKFEFFDSATNIETIFWGPLYAGLSVGLASPFFKLFSAWWAAWPILELKKIQRSNAIKLDIHDAEMKIRDAEVNATLEEKLQTAETAKAERLAETERQLLAAEKRLQDAEAISPTLVGDLLEHRKEEQEGTKENWIEEQVETLDLTAQLFLKGLALNNSGEGAVQFGGEQRSATSELSFEFAEGDPPSVALGKHRRTKLFVQKSIDRLLELQFITETHEHRSGQFDVYSITEIGYEGADIIDDSFDELLSLLLSLNRT